MKFSPAVEDLRKIVAARSHGEAANFRRNGIWLVYRARYQRATARVATLVRAAGGTVNEMGKSGSSKLDAAGRVVGNAQPYYIEFDLDNRDAEVFVETGARINTLRLVNGKALR